MGKKFQERLNDTLNQAVQRGFVYAGNVITKALNIILDAKDLTPEAKLEGVRTLVDKITELNSEASPDGEGALA